MRTVVLSAVSGKAAASRAGRRVHDAGRGPAEVGEVGDPLLGLAEVGLHQPPVMGQVGELALHRRIECRTAPARRGGTPGPDGRRGADPPPLYHHR
jgi:hypothetical protein